MRHASTLLILFLTLPVQAQPRSGHDDATPAVQAMQDDDTANPAFLWIARGEQLWSEGARSCASCHGAPAAMRGVAARYPVVENDQVLTLPARINRCRAEHQAAPPLEPDSEAMLALSALVGLQSRFMPVAVRTDGPAAAHVEAGREVFTTRMGQLDLSCAQCHDGLAGHRLGGSTIPEGHPNGYPIYRLEWQGMGSLARRIRNCLTGIRATPFAPDDPALADLELFLAARSTGLTVETPAVRP
ncbi:MAG TPA: sulfur oxidation c-type cytochrome SoxA [Acetobacteraceae bacterium]